MDVSRWGYSQNPWDSTRRLRRRRSRNRRGSLGDSLSQQETIRWRMSWIRSQLRTDSSRLPENHLTRRWPGVDPALTLQEETEPAADERWRLIVRPDGMERDTLRHWRTTASWENGHCGAFSSVHRIVTSGGPQRFLPCRITANFGAATWQVNQTDMDAA